MQGVSRGAHAQYVVLTPSPPQHSGESLCGVIHGGVKAGGGGGGGGGGGVYGRPPPPPRPILSRTHEATTALTPVHTAHPLSWREGSQMGWLKGTPYVCRR